MRIRLCFSTFADPLVVKKGEWREGQTASGGQSPRFAFVRYSKRKSIGFGSDKQRV
jgi:hypothetical protein